MTPEKDSLNPSYYKSDSGLEAIHVIEAFNLSFVAGTVFNYLVRAGKQYGESEIKDMKKAHWYLSREIWHLEEQKRNEQMAEFMAEERAAGRRVPEGEATDGSA